MAPNVSSVSHPLAIPSSDRSRSSVARVRMFPARMSTDHNASEERLLSSERARWILFSRAHGN